MERARDAWRRAIAAMVRYGSENPRVAEWHRAEERERMSARRARMTLWERRDEWLRHQRARRARKVAA